MAQQIATGQNQSHDQPYGILAPKTRMEGRAALCALAVMAKAPRAGKVKTRLSPPLTLQESAALNICFLRDTTRNIGDVAAEGASEGLVCYTPVGDEAAFDGLLPKAFTLLSQRGDGFGERLLAAAEDILACGYGSVCLIDSDSPTLPTAALQQAVKALGREGDRIVLGGSQDGGYYLIGLKRAHAIVFEQINWSTSSVYAETVARAREAKLEVFELPLWYDVDDAESLSVLETELLDGQRPVFVRIDGYAAASTAEYLADRRRSSDPDAVSSVASAVGSDQ